MNVDRVLSAMNECGVRYLLIGGMNFMLRHKPLLTYDIDLWIDDTDTNRRLCEQALANLNAKWGSTEELWQPVSNLPLCWMDQQVIYCLNSPHGAVDIMRVVRGLENWQRSWKTSIEETTAHGTPYRGLSDADMLQCQLALEESQRRSERVCILREVLDE